MTLEEKVTIKIRRKIIEGELPPGSRLPDRQELSRQYNLSIPVLQGVIDRLVKQKYIEIGARKLGTRVAEVLPNQYRYKLIFPGNRKLMGFFRTLYNVAEVVTANTTREISFFYGFSGHQDLDAYRQVVDEVANEQLAGLIFASSAQEFDGTPLLKQKGIPRSFISNLECVYDTIRDFPIISVDFDSFINQAIDFLKQKGRKRIALLSNNYIETYDAWQKAINEHNLERDPVWEQFADIYNPLAADHVMRLMFHGGQKVRPDGLIIADDNFTHSATKGIIAAGVNVPGDLSIVSLNNFPAKLKTELPVTQLGFDVGKILAVLINRIDAQRKGETVPGMELIPAIFEDEYADGPSYLTLL